MVKTEYFGPPQSPAKESRNNPVERYRKNKIILYVIQALVFIFLVIALASTRYEMSLTQLDESTEQAIFFGIAALLVIIWALFWRCPNCGYHFLWRTHLSICRKCGAELVELPVTTESSDKADSSYYLKKRRTDTLKYWFSLFVIVIVNLFIIWFVMDIFPAIIVVIIFAMFELNPLLIIDDKFHRCPKCGFKYANYMLGPIPKECPSCKTRLK